MTSLFAHFVVTEFQKSGSKIMYHTPTQVAGIKHSFLLLYLLN